MKMTMRWFGRNNDSVTLEQIRQVPGVTGVVGALHHIPVGEVWPLGEVLALKEEVEASGLTLEVIESVNIHEDIKLGRGERDLYIRNYLETLRNLAQIGIKVVCYNFMPIFDWTRSALDKPLEDGSTAMEYMESLIGEVHPEKIAQYMQQNSKDFSFPGWEPEKLARLGELFEAYNGMTEESLRENLRYFLNRVIPVCRELGIKMAIHPDDPPWPIFGLPRIVKNRKDLAQITQLVDDEANGITLCSGCLGTCRDNDIPALVREFAPRIHFAHIRNIKFTGPRDFHEVAHPSDQGDLDLYEILRAYHERGFTGYIRPDHGRMVWGEQARPGYGLYDRAMGITYMLGILEALNKK